MENKANEIVKQQLKIETATAIENGKTEVQMAATTSTGHIDSDINLNHLKQEPGLVQCVKSEPALLVKEEILMDISQDGNEQQCVKGTLTPDDAGSGNEACGTSDLLHVKQELGEMDIGPTVLQHMDIYYTMSKNTSADIEENTIVDDYNEEISCGGVKKENSEDKLIDSIAPQKATMNERSGCSTLQNPQLAAHKDNLEFICRVNLMRLDAFQCELCNAVYTEKHWLLKHLNTVHGSSLQTSLLVKCREAKKHKSTAEHRKLHVRNSKISVTTGSAIADPTHTGKGSYQCDRCDARFAQNGALTMHMRIHTGEKTYQYNTCDARFADTSTSTRHARVHTGKKPYQCTICVARFAQNAALTIHMRVHTGEKPYQCTTCDARFAQNGALTIHMRVHTGEKPYQCTTCDARFAQNGALTMHMRVHTAEKPYTCNTCDARFEHSGSLAKHVRVHTGEKPYQCNTCDARFAQMGALTRHMRIHTGEKPYQCNTCDVRFAHGNALTTHIRVHTGEKPFQCNTCVARFAQKGALIRHVRVHTGEKPYQCNTCDTRFAHSNALSTHMRVHTREKRYKCTTCDARFALKGKLTIHMRVHIQKGLRVQ